MKKFVFLILLITILLAACNSDPYLVNLTCWSGGKIIMQGVYEYKWTSEGAMRLRSHETGADISTTARCWAEEVQ